MKEIRVSVHSVVDVITNSSTEIYTYPVSNAVKGATDILKELMDKLGVPGNVEDYFEVKMTTQRDYDLETDQVTDFDLFPEAQGLTDDEKEALLGRLIEDEDQRIPPLVDDKYRNLVVRYKGEGKQTDVAAAFIALFDSYAEYS